MANLTQEQLDRLIRKAAGKNAVEEMVRETRTSQVYVLSDGSTLTISKRSGKTQLSKLNAGGFDPRKGN